MLRPKFISGYQGESSFDVNGVRYDVRIRAPRPLCHSFKADHYADSVVPSVGTVRRAYDSAKFPPAEVVAHFPGFVGARWNPETHTIEYDGPAPETHTDSFGLVAAAPNPHLSLSA